LNQLRVTRNRHTVVLASPVFSSRFYVALLAQISSQSFHPRSASYGNRHQRNAPSACGHAPRHTASCLVQSRRTVASSFASASRTHAPEYRNDVRRDLLAGHKGHHRNRLHTYQPRGPWQTPVSSPAGNGFFVDSPQLMHNHHFPFSTDTKSCPRHRKCDSTFCPFGHASWNPSFGSNEEHHACAVSDRCRNITSPIGASSLLQNIRPSLSDRYRQFLHRTCGSLGHSRIGSGTLLLCAISQPELIALPPFHVNRTHPCPHGFSVGCVWQWPGCVQQILDFAFQFTGPGQHVLL
jgi:hypothetical protein